MEGNKETTGKKLKRRFVRSPEERSAMKVTVLSNNNPSVSDPDPDPVPVPVSLSSVSSHTMEVRSYISLVRDRLSEQKDIFTFEASQGEDITSPPHDAVLKVQPINLRNNGPSLAHAEDLISKVRVNEEVEEIVDTDEEESKCGSRITKIDAEACHSVSCAPIATSSSSSTSITSSSALSSSSSESAPYPPPLIDGPKGRLFKGAKQQSPKKSPTTSRTSLHDVELVHEDDVPAYLTTSSNWTTVWRALKLAGWYFKKGTGLVDGHYLRPGERR